MKKGFLFLLLVLLSVMLCSCSSNQPKSGFSAEDMKASFDGKTLMLNADMSEVFAVLGEDYQYSEQTSCYYAGMDKTYQYTGVTVITYPSPEGAEKVCEIRLTNDTYATAKGAKLGMSQTEIETIYGNEYKSSGILMEYHQSENEYLSFAIIDDKVDRISYILIP